jgi:hypothetical protein
MALMQLGATISYQSNAMTGRPESMTMDNKANTTVMRMTGVVISNRGSRMDMRGLIR